MYWTITDYYFKVQTNDSNIIMDSGEKTIWQWIVTTSSVVTLWENQPTYIISQAVFILAGLVTLIHAIKKGGRWPYFWLTTVLHGLYADNFWHFVVPEYDNFWHSQTPVMLLGARLPLHVIFLYPAFIYHAAYAVSRLNLPKYAEPFAVGLLTVLIDIPYDIVAVKFVHWTWHDTDPNVYDRHYWVPWNSYYFHATFAASLYFFFTNSVNWSTSNFPFPVNRVGEWKSVIIATFLGMPGGVLLFVPIYHPLHDILNIHSEVTVFLLFTVFACFTLTGIMSVREKNVERLTKLDYALLTQLAIHYIIYWVFVVFFDPQKEISIGLHEPVGPCNEISFLTTPFGQTLPKRKYFCPSDYDEQYFDFHCVDRKPDSGTTWYTICGTPFENRMEYVAVISAILLFAAVNFFNIYFNNPENTVSSKRLKMN